MTFSHGLRWTAVASVAIVLLLAWVAAANAATLRTDFREDVVFSGLTQPTNVAFAPTGEVFVAEKSGLIKRFSDTSDTTSDIVADLRVRVHDFWDRGLLAIALSPDFATSRAMYVLYTYDAPLGGVAPVYSDQCSDPD